MKTKGQSTVEYIVLVAAVIAVVITLTTGSGSLFQTRLTNTANTLMNGMETQAGRLMNQINQ